MRSRAVQKDQAYLAVPRPKKWIVPGSAAPIPSAWDEHSQTHVPGTPGNRHERLAPMAEIAGPSSWRANLPDILRPTTPRNPSPRSFGSGELQGETEAEKIKRSVNFGVSEL